MKLEGEFTFSGPRTEVWDVLRDPEVLAKCIPGTQSLNVIKPGEFEGAINLHVGPVSGAFSGKVNLTDEVAPESLTLTAEGKGAPGFAKGVGYVKLADAPEGKTLMTYTGDLQIGGKLASVGQRLLDGVGKSMIKQGCETMDKALVAKLAGKATDELKAPTQAEFAAGVAKEMTKTGPLAIAEVRMLLYVIPVGIIIAIIGYLLSR